MTTKALKTSMQDTADNQLLFGVLPAMVFSPCLLTLQTVWTQIRPDRTSGLILTRSV